MSDHGKEAMTDYSDEQIAALVQRLREDCIALEQCEPGNAHELCFTCQCADALASLQQAKREVLALCVRKQNELPTYDATYFFADEIRAIYKQKETTG